MHSQGPKSIETHAWIPADEKQSARVNGAMNRTFGGLKKTVSVNGLGSTLTIHNIRYSVDVKDKCCSSKTLEIINGIDGIFRPGMNAIIGASGSGKSSLLDVLAGRKNPSGLSGDLLLDGNPVPDNFKCMVGYVVQDDVVMGTLSVRENFHFSAALRLPSTIGNKEREERVDNVIQELGLQHCADSKVGNEFIRGISGGERKRCNIGMELIISPPVLFLDEPTTGLDANTASTVMTLLKQLSKRGRTIIFSIHQPRYSIYRLFDRLMLLSFGEIVYHGPADQSLSFFQDAGYTCEEHNNPPDFFLDVIHGDAEYNDISIGSNSEVLQITDSQTVQRSLVAAFKKSKWNQNLQNELTPILQEHANRVQLGTIVKLPCIQYATSPLVQFLYCSQRTLRNLIRNPAVSVLQVATMAFFALIVGAIYWKIDDSCKSGLQNRVGAFFFIIMNMVFGNLSAVELFIKNRVIFLHENVSGFYRVSAFFFATVLCDVVPMRLLPTCAFSAIVYYMLGLQPAFVNFLIFFLCLFAVSLAASAISFLISAMVRIMAVANLLIAMVYVIMMIFSGLLVNLDTIPNWLEWLKYLSIFKYSFAALNINELKDMTFVLGNSSEHVMNCVTGNQYLDQQGISYETAWDLWVNYVALGIMAVGYLTLAFLRLLFMNKLR